MLEDATFAPDDTAPEGMYTFAVGSHAATRSPTDPKNGLETGRMHIPSRTELFFSPIHRLE